MNKYRGHTGCESIREMLSAYIDDELDTGERQVVDLHLESCSLCREEYESMRKTVDLLRKLPLVESERSFTVNAAKVKTWNVTLKVLSGVTALAATCLLVIIVGDMLHYFNLPAVPALPGAPQPEMEKCIFPVREIECILFAIVVFLITGIIVYRRKRAKTLLRRN